MTTAAIQPDTLQLPGPDLFDLPLTPIPRDPGQKRPQIAPGKPRKRQYGKDKLGAAKHTVSMKSFEKSPAEIATGLGLRPLE